jgi:hypothetical protein
MIKEIRKYLGLSLVMGLVLGARFMAGACAAEPAPDAAIKFKVTIDGRSTVGLVALGDIIGLGAGSKKELSAAQKLALGAAFDAAIIPVKIGKKVPISINVRRANGSIQTVNQDSRLYVTSSPESLKFDRSGFLTVEAPPGMPKIDPGAILTMYLYFFPDRENHKHYGFDVIYFRATK